jgi:hypothetical protein
MPAERSWTADSASDPAYGDGWQGLNGVVAAEMGMDNGGSVSCPGTSRPTEGFWEALHSPTANPISSTPNPLRSTTLERLRFASRNANVPLEGYTTIATRPFAQALRVGDQLSLDIDIPRDAETGGVRQALASS